MRIVRIKNNNIQNGGVSESYNPSSFFFVSKTPPIMEENISEHKNDKL